MKKPINHTCPKCGFYIRSCIQKHIKACDGSGPRRKKPKKYPEGFKGKTYEELFGKQRANEIKEKISKSLKLNARSGIAGTKEKELARRKKISYAMKAHGGYRRGSGRGKCGWYCGFWLDSSWELAFLLYCLDNDILIQRNQKRFQYEYQEQIHEYIPDFLISGEVYYEIKGYYTDQVQAKIEQFPEQLVIIDKDSISTYLNYAISGYGTNFIDLYE